jgi:hypothetical protein
MTSEVTDPPRSGRPPAAGGIAWHTLSAGEVPHSPPVDGQCGLSSAGAATRAQRPGASKLAEGKTEPRWLILLRSCLFPSETATQVGPQSAEKDGVTGDAGIEHPAPAAGHAVRSPAKLARQRNSFATSGSSRRSSTGDQRSMAQHHGSLLACKESRMPATKMRIGLVSGTVNTDMNNQY